MRGPAAMDNQQAFRASRRAAGTRDDQWRVGGWASRSPDREQRRQRERQQPGMAREQRRRRNTVIGAIPGQDQQACPTRRQPDDEEPEPFSSSGSSPAVTREEAHRNRRRRWPTSARSLPHRSICQQAFARGRGPVIGEVILDQLDLGEVRRLGRHRRHGEWRESGNYRCRRSSVSPASAPSRRSSWPRPSA